MKSNRDEFIIGLQQTGQLVIYCPVISDPEDVTHPRIARGITDNLKGWLPFFLFLISLIRNLITVILIILYYE